MVRLVNDHWELGILGIGKLATATASGMSPLSKAETIDCKTAWMFWFMVILLDLGIKKPPLGIPRKASNACFTGCFCGLKERLRVQGIPGPRVPVWGRIRVEINATTMPYQINLTGWLRGPINRLSELFRG
jgi:hypothetical protein